jgi:hypothetical protein
MSKTPVSPRKLAANRRNARLSKGPITPEGKAKSSRNATRHGMLAKTIVLEGESEERYLELLADLTTQFKPRNRAETICIETMATSRWLEERVLCIQKFDFALAMARVEPTIAGPPPQRASIAFRTLADTSRALDLVHRYTTSYSRQFSRAISLFLKLRAELPDSFDQHTAPASPCNPLTTTWETPPDPDPDPQSANFPNDPTEPEPAPVDALPDTELESRSKNVGTRAPHSGLLKFSKSAALSPSSLCEESSAGPGGRVSPRGSC